MTCPFALPALTRSPGQAVENAVHTGSADGAYTYWSKQFSPQHCAAGRCGVFVPCSWRGSNCRASCTYLSYCQPAEASAQALYLKMCIEVYLKCRTWPWESLPFEWSKTLFQKKLSLLTLPLKWIQSANFNRKASSPPFFCLEITFGN